MNRKESLEIAVLNQISQAVIRVRDASALLKWVLEILSREMGLLRGTVTLRRGDILLIVASHGLSSEEIKRGRYHLGEGITGMVAQTGRPRIVPDISNEPEFLDRTRARGRSHKNHIAFICVPIVYRGEVIGTLSIDREMAEGADLQRDFNLLEIVANLTAEAISLGSCEHEEKTRLIAENARLKQALEGVENPPEIIGNCQAMRQVYAMIEQVAASNATVLIRGGSGTGKELIARALQQRSPRRDKPFVVVNTAALPEGLIESELFGHEKGAFTGAVSRRIGRVEAADAGTLFLDEIGDLAPQIQVKLLRFLQERTFQRVGGNTEYSSDVRIVAATSRNLEELMRQGRFREDLYYRLNVFPILLPELRDRKSDIPLLAEHFLSKYSALHGKKLESFSPAAMNLMLNYPWPGNVRELENCIERAVITADDVTVLPFMLPAPVRESSGGGVIPDDFSSRVAAFERELICDALRESRGNAAGAARKLNLSIRIIHYKIKKLGIAPADFKA